MFIRSTRALLDIKDYDQCEVVFQVLAETHPAPDIFSADYNPDAEAAGSSPWMRWSDFRSAFARQTPTQGRERFHAIPHALCLALDTARRERRIGMANACEGTEHPTAVCRLHPLKYSHGVDGTADEPISCLRRFVTAKECPSRCFHRPSPSGIRALKRCNRQSGQNISGQPPTEPIQVPRSASPRTPGLARQAHAVLSYPLLGRHWQ